MSYDAKRVTLAKGSGGLDSAIFIQDVFMPYLHDIMDNSNDDGATFSNDCKKYITSIDSYIINPIFFNGGDIGKLCICGSSNDVAMMGAKPLYINIAFIIEEGFLITDLKRILQSIREECEILGLKILSADTKVLPKLSHSVPANIFINTTCIGSQQRDIGIRHIAHNDSIIINASIGTHGARIFLDQNHMDIDSDIASDCASLYNMLEPLLQSNIPLHAMRDATRGGLSSVLNEWARDTKSCIYINECNIHIPTQVRGVCEMLGLEPYDLANEGVCVIALPREYEKEALEILRHHRLGKESSAIGYVDSSSSNVGRVILNTDYGSKRFLEYPQGELLPRIC